PHHLPLTTIPSLPIIFILPPPPSSTLFPYTTLFRSPEVRPASRRPHGRRTDALARRVGHRDRPARRARLVRRALPLRASAESRRDRKSTRLNSSHSQISYAVFCLKKKKNKKTKK